MAELLQGLEGERWMIVPAGLRVGRFLAAGARSARRAATGRVCALGGVIDFSEVPFSQVTYAYPCRPAARVSLDGWAEPMRHELLWLGRGRFTPAASG